MQQSFKYHINILCILKYLKKFSLILFKKKLVRLVCRLIKTTNMLEIEKNFCHITKKGAITLSKMSLDLNYFQSFLCTLFVSNLYEMTNFSNWHFIGKSYINLDFVRSWALNVENISKIVKRFYELLTLQSRWHC